MIKVSVILTTYNSESFIEETINCILNQEGLNELFTLEILVMDDCSKDQTEQICNKYDLEFHSNEQNSGGPNKGRNLGLRKATGDYICLCDHDDKWSSDKLKSQLEYAHLAPIISGGYCVQNTTTNKTIIRGNNIIAPKFFDKNETLKSLLKRSFSGQVVYLSGILFSAELKVIEFEETFGFLDYDWFVRLFENQKSLQVPSILFTRVVGNTNLSFNEKYRLLDYEIGINTIENYKVKYPKECAIGRSKFNGTLARYYYLIGDMPESRKYLKLSGFNTKNVLYYLTSFYGHRIVKKYFHFFG